MEIKRSTDFAPELQVKLATSEGEIEGYASTFGNVDHVGDVVMPGAFSITLAPGNRRNIKMFWSHDPSEPIGVWDELVVDAKGLRVKGRLAMGTQRGREARELARMGTLALSIGFRTKKFSYDRDGNRLLDEVDLFEISLVSIPANPAAEILDVKMKGESMEHRILFEAFLRNPRVSHAALYAFQQKNITIADTAGLAVPTSVAAELDRQVQASNPFRVLHGPARQTSSEQTRYLLSLDDAGSETVSETATRNTTASPSLRETLPTYGEYRALPAASGAALEDMQLDVVEWLAQAVGDKLGADEANDIIRGDGTAKITGFLDTAPSTTADDASPARDADSLQYLDGSGALLSNLIDLVASVKPGYRAGPNVGWVVHPDALALIRKAQTTAGQPVSEGTILGFPVLEAEAMDAPGQSPAAFPIAFGNWRRGLVIANRTGLKVSADEVTLPGFQRFNIRRRVGGRVHDNRAIKLLKV